MKDSSGTERRRVGVVKLRKIGRRAARSYHWTKPLELASLRSGPAGGLIAVFSLLGWRASNGRPSNLFAPGESVRQRTSLRLACQAYHLSMQRVVYLALGISLRVMTRRLAANIGRIEFGKSYSGKAPASYLVYPRPASRQPLGPFARVGGLHSNWPESKLENRSPGVLPLSCSACHAPIPPNERRRVSSAVCTSPASF